MTHPLAIAWSTFTVLPSPTSLLPGHRKDEELLTHERARRAMAWLPTVGFGVGIVAGAVAWLVGWLHGSSLLAGMAGLAALAMSTGCLHLDGLGDTADGLGSRRPPEQALAIMKRSDIGPMGVSAIVLVLLLDAAVLSSPAICLVAVLPLAPAIARTSVLRASRESAGMANPNGFGALFSGASMSSVVVNQLVWAATAFGVGTWTGGWWAGLHYALAAMLAWLFAALWQRHLAARLGGMTGDTFGSLIEMTQLVFLLGCALG